MKSLISKYKFELIGIPFGALCGWLYWYFIGCSSGSCAITSSPLNSALYGAIMCSLLFGLFGDSKKKETVKK